MEQNDNLAIYNIARVVPDEAKKSITAGRLKGMTDINPMWRIKRLTEIFGPCGVGWWYIIKDKRIEDDAITKQRAAFVDIDLYYTWDGAVSMPIPGTGGAAFVSQERNGPYMSDECYKMALTDAISVAAKALGIGADVYFEKDRDKYTDKTEGDSAGDSDGEPAPIYCESCNTRIQPYTDAKGKTVGIIRWASSTREAFGRVLCPACVERQKAIGKLKQYDEVTVIHADS